MKRVIIILLYLFMLLIFSINAFSQEFGPPVYIANPVTGECRYYFAGDPKHYNPRPENFTFNIGLTTETNCDLWYLCRNSSKPGIGWAEGRCVCAHGLEFNETEGCLPEKPKFQIIACTNTSGFWEASQPENFSCSNYCDNTRCRRVNCSWLPGCVCPLGREWNYTLGCIRKEEQRGILSRITALLRKIFK